MVLVVIPLEELSATDLIVTGFGLVRLTVLETKRTGGRIPRGKPWDRQPVSGKLRRKLVSVPGLAARYNRWGIPREQRRLSCERKLRLWAPATSARIARCALPTRNSPMSSWWTWWRVFRKARGSICSNPARYRATISTLRAPTITGRRRIGIPPPPRRVPRQGRGCAATPYCCQILKHQDGDRGGSPVF